MLAQHVIWGIGLLQSFVYEPSFLKDTRGSILVILH